MDLIIVCLARRILRDTMLFFEKPPQAGDFHATVSTTLESRTTIWAQYKEYAYSLSHSAVKASWSQLPTTHYLVPVISSSELLHLSSAVKVPTSSVIACILQCFYELLVSQSIISKK